MNRQVVVVKYGGNAMVDERLQENVIRVLAELYQRGIQIVLVHGGGPFINRILDLANLQSTFVDGHRKTSPEALKYIEMALKGEVNGKLVNLLAKAGTKAVGLSGKDGSMIVAEKRYHVSERDGLEVKQDLGQVGNVKEVNTHLIRLLLDNVYLPVVTCIASDQDGNDYNINADMFAGFLAGHLRADHYLVLTDVDGLLQDVKDSSTLLSKLTTEELVPLIGTTVQGGMIPKVESCMAALKLGAKSARIINGTKPDMIAASILNNNNNTGTQICI